MTDFFSKTSKGTSPQSSSSGVQVVLPASRPNPQSTLVSSLLASDGIDQVSYLLISIQYSGGSRGDPPPYFGQKKKK